MGLDSEARSTGTAHSGREEQAGGREDRLQGLSTLHLMMGSQCNVRCVMCYQPGFSPKDAMPPALYLERLAAAYPRVATVILRGGEPTVMSNCRELATRLRAVPGVRISTSTNGVRLEGFWRELLRQQGGEINVSLNAAREATYRKVVLGGDFRRVVANVRALRPAGADGLPRLTLSLVVLKENVHELAEFIELAHDLSADAVRCAIDPVLSFSGLPPRPLVAAELWRAQEAARRTRLEVTGLEAFGRRFGLPAPEPQPAAEQQHCHIPFDQLAVDSQGDVRACPATWEPLGNLYRSSLEEIWNGPATARLRELVSRGDHSRCEPWCPHNVRPSRTALVRKYAFHCLRDPAWFARKLRRKVQQLRRPSAPPGLAGFDPG